MPYAVLVALGLVAASSAVSGVALILLRRSRLTGTLLVLTAAALVTAVTLDSTGHRDGARLAVLVAVQVGVVALTVYPRAWVQHALDFLALALVAGVPLVTLVTAAGNIGSSGYASPEAFTTVAVVVLLLHTWWRLERSSGSERWALSWMALSVGVALLVAGVVGFAVTVTPSVVAACLTFGLVGPALYVGVSRPEVVDVRGLVVRCVVFATALLGYVALFATAAAFLELIGGQQPSTTSLALVGALCAVTFHPLQVILRGVVDELLFGQRPDPLGAASQVADHIGDDPVLALRTIREALVLPYARLLLDGAELARSGVPVTHTRTILLTVGEGRTGELDVGLRPGDLGLTAADERVLRLVAPLLAQTLRARALAAEVQAAREGTVAALEEERRRLRRDLHDGLGPRLSGIAFTSDAARNSVRRDPQSAERLLSELRAETETAIREIRELVYGLRPPALDELGLVPALRQATSALRTPDGLPFTADVEAAELPQLPAAVEVAAYRIAVEALTNAARHSRSDRAEARICLDDGALVVEVTDQGSGADGWSPGVGLASMRERAVELGGTFSVHEGVHGGQVRAVLPLVR